MSHNPTMSKHAPANFSRPHPHPRAPRERLQTQPMYSIFPKEGVSHQNVQFRAEVIALQGRQTVNVRHLRPHAKPTYSLFPQERVSQQDAQFNAEMIALRARQTVNLRAKLRAMPQPPPVQPQFLGSKKLQSRTREKEKEVGCCIVM